MDDLHQLLHTTILYFSNVVFLIIQNRRSALHSAYSKKISGIDRLARLKYLFNKRLLFPKAHGNEAFTSSRHCAKCHSHYIKATVYESILRCHSRLMISIPLNIILVNVSRVVPTRWGHVVKSNQRTHNLTISTSYKMVRVQNER